MYYDELYYDEFVNEVNLLPGIGCPHYLSISEAKYPSLEADYLHYTMYEYIQGSTTTRTFSEIYASGKHNILRIKSTLLGVKTEAVYDYNLGVSYLFEEGGSCNVFPADKNSPGIESDGRFYLHSLFLFDSNFQYLGKFHLEHRSGLPVYAWESIRFNVNINGKKVDKAVITQYFAKSHGSEIFYGYTLVSTEIAIYKLDSTKKTYTFTDRITRDYMNFEKAGFEDELHDIFTLKDCKYLSSDKTLTLAFKLQHEVYDRSSQKLTEDHVYELKQRFMYYIISSKKISRLRIDTVHLNFNDAQLEIEVTFLDTLRLQFTFRAKTMSVSADTFKKLNKIKASNETACLDELSKFYDQPNVVIYRPSDFSCGYSTDFEDLKEDAEIGEPCSVYHFPLKNLRRINQEIPLDQIHNTFLKEVEIRYSLFNAYSDGLFKLIDVIDKTKNKDTSAGGFQSTIRVGEKLKSNDQVTVTVPDVKTLTDCYRNCHDSEQLKCNIFSFCSNGDCRVSSLLTVDLYNESHVEQDKSCSIHALNSLNDYLEVPHRKFKSPTSIAVDKSVDACAESCHASSDCFSFQWCDYQCSFGGFYTDAATEYDGECSVFLPKVSEKYQKAGTKIVSDVLYTEMNLNFEQCASLCHGWSDGETGCKSFNYCPKSKTESSCSLTQFSVKSSNTKTIEGGDCSNYELKVESNGKKSKESSSTAAGTSGSSAFGIIMLFLLVGALLGFAAPFGYKKVEQMRSASEANESFTWTRQVNEQAENIS
ncbi:uncharacterized protein LOC107370957 [Tetranychus urticae]|uniref:uncharacterized protein LOC107370957 n=1 Tax=Tetranychus urticae TaxID=32264 RepID=UPI000D656BB8|nr:uncharacterized protein LOC107370957 [Tetranychus urticae]